MIPSLTVAVLASALAAPAPRCDDGHVPELLNATARVATLEEVYRGGHSWDEFYAGVDARRELWQSSWTHSAVPEDLAARARAAGPWRILIITEARCSDSANSVPYVGKLVEQTPGLELRLVNSAVGRPWMEAHRSPDGRPSTPTILVLDEKFAIRGCWVEQPAALQSFWLPIVARGEASAELNRKMEWYAADAGRETLRELVEVLEGARTGRMICPGGSGGASSS
jgi:hypothetical protein